VTAFQAPTGTRDVLAPESARIERLVGVFATLARRAAYGLVLSPMFEESGVFRRGVGEASDIVTKEMYEFEDRGGRRFALRPEGTASVVRAYIQHRPQTPFKAWYVTPAFRYERPQAGRYRQHHQLGVEAIGTADADLDVEVIVLLADYLHAVGLRQLSLRLNSMGDDECRPAYVARLEGFLGAHAAMLCAEHTEGWSRNPLRVLDCKREECVALRPQMPRLADQRCAGCEEHFARVREGLDALSVPYVLDDFLVRGLDYYTRTTFEFGSDALQSAQNAVGGGGRYDKLASALSGPDTPGIGFATGIERVLLALEAEGAAGEPEPAAEVFLADLTGGGAARDLSVRLRRAGFSVERGFDQRSLKAQLRQADRVGALVALIVGEQEAERHEVTARVLRGELARTQSALSLGVIEAQLHELLGKARS
jgi:histidyl-tRNA synthetase